MYYKIFAAIVALLLLGFIARAQQDYRVILAQIDTLDYTDHYKEVGAILSFSDKIDSFLQADVVMTLAMVQKGTKSYGFLNELERENGVSITHTGENVDYIAFYGVWAYHNDYAPFESGYLEVGIYFFNIDGYDYVHVDMIEDDTKLLKYEGVALSSP